MDKVNITAGMLKWARENAFLTLEEASAKAKITEKQGFSPAARLEAMENGTEPVSYSTLEKLARAYHRPVLTFYLSKPPVADDKTPDFRVCAQDSIRTQARNPMLGALIRRIRARQEQIHELLADEGASALPFIRRFDLNTPAEKIAQDIQNEIKFQPNDHHRCKDRDALFRTLRQKIEEAGVFVQLIGDLGNHKTILPPEVFRGFVLIDDLAPFIVINPKDAPAAHLFTLIHELAHIWIGEPGISNADIFSEHVASGQIEQQCNAVAAEFLVPRIPFMEDWRKQEKSTPSSERIATLAKSRKVSRAVIARRARELQLISRAEWLALHQSYQKEWQRQQEALKEKDGSPGWYRMTARKLGAGLLTTTLRALNNGEITYMQASRILNLNVKTFDGLRKELEPRKERAA